MTDLKPEDRALKPCAHCGCENIVSSYQGQPASAFVLVCMGCGASGPPSTLVTGSGMVAEGAFAEAVERWNTRAEGLRSPSGGGEGEEGFIPERVTGGCADAGPCPHSPTFKVGDVVTIFRSVSSSPGWTDVWVSSMDEMVGKSGMIEAERDGGFEIGEYSFPAEVLRLNPNGGEAVHARPLSAASAEPKDSLSAPTGEVGGVIDELEGVIADLESSGWARAPGCIKTLKRVASIMGGGE